MTRVVEHTIVSLSCLFLAAACVEPISLDPMEEMPVVVNCVLTKNDVQTLNLFYARRPSESGYINISDASVQISGGGQTHEFAWADSCWRSEFTPEYGVRYSLSVTLNDGKTLTSRTDFPKEMMIYGTPIYVMNMHNSWSKYYQIFSWVRDTYFDDIRLVDEEVFVWFTPHGEYRDRVSNFCTNHPGADHENVTGTVWEELPIASILEEDYKNVASNPFGDADPEVWKQFKAACTGLPAHKNFLRIHHTPGFEGGTPGPLYQMWDEKETLEDGFALAADLMVDITPPGTIGGQYIALPIRSYFLSKEYDTYLKNVVKADIHGDELASKYSMDLNYTNIEGGLGIFGSLYWRDYVL